MQLSSFQPPALSLAVGDTVRWADGSSMIHTTTSGTPGNPSGIRSSGDLYNGGTFTFVFKTSWNYSYYCMNHSSMTGIMTVGGESSTGGGGGTGYSGY